jgi:hypothetical protein
MYVQCWHVLACTSPSLHDARDLCKLAGTTRLNRVNLGLGPRHALEAGGQLRAVEEEAVAGLDRSERGAWGAADPGRVVAGLVEGAVLLSLLAVGCKGLGKRAGGGGRVDVGGVVDLGGGRALAQKADERLAALLEDLCGVHLEGGGGEGSGDDGISGGGGGDEATERLRRDECAEVGALGVLWEVQARRTTTFTR